MLRVLVASLVASLAGCATHMVPMAETRAIPADRIFAVDATQPVPGAHKLTVARNAGALFAAAAKVELSVDGRHIASLATSESIALYLQPGEHLLLAKIGALGQVFSSISVNVPSKFSIYRIDMTDNDIKLQPSID